MAFHCKVGSKEEVASLGMKGMMRVGDLSIEIVPYHVLFQTLTIFLTMLHHKPVINMLEFA